MKRITLFRHGKSSWSHQGVSDADRPLLPKGVRRTRRVAEELAALSMAPELMITSHAVRALHTATIVADILKLPKKVLITDPHLYHATSGAIWDVVSALPEEADHVMLFGHNPGFTEFINSSGITTIDCLPTSGVASAAFHCQQWEQCPGTIPADPFVILPRNL